MRVEVPFASSGLTSQKDASALVFLVLVVAEGQVQELGAHGHRIENHRRRLSRRVERSAEPVPEEVEAFVGVDG